MLQFAPQARGQAARIGAPKQSGVTFGSWWPGQYASADGERALRNAAQSGAGWVALIVTQYQETIASVSIAAGPATPSDADLIYAINLAHELGLKVMLKPHVDLAGDPEHGRGAIGQGFHAAQWAAWFASYQVFIGHYAQLAQAHGVEQLCIGTELSAAESRASEWRAVAAAVRSQYNGALTYAAIGDGWDLTWWEALDYIGLNAYYPLTDENDPTLAELKAAWESRLPSLAALSQSWNRPILFTEIGYLNRDGANRAPWDWTISGTIDLQEQADAYQAVFESVYQQPWFAGLYWWLWLVDPADGGPCDSGFSPYDKPAEDVLRAWYGAPPRRGVLDGFQPDEARAVEVFGDSLAAGWQDVSLGVTVAPVSSPVHQGSRALAVTAPAWGSLSLHYPNLEISPYHWLEFYVRKTATNQPLRVYANDESDIELRYVSECHYTGGDTIPSDTWRRVRIPLSELVGNRQAIQRISIKNYSSQPGTFWIDAMRLVAADQPFEVNLISNGGFEIDLQDWHLLVDAASGAQASLERDTSAAGDGLASAKIAVTAASPANYHVALVQDNLAVLEGAHYTLSFQARASAPRLISNIAVQEGGGDWTAYSGYQQVTLTPVWRDYEITFISSGTDSQAWLTFCLGDVAGQVWIDQVRLVRSSPELRPGRVRLRTGDSQVFTFLRGAAPYQWASSNPAVGSLVPGSSGTASFQASAPGSTQISVTDAHGLAASAWVEVIQRSTISVEVGSRLLQVPEQAFGSNAEYYNAAWGQVLTDSTFVEAVQEMGVSGLRYPGGGEATYYDFSRGQGWLSWMPGSENQYNYNGVDTAHFLNFARDADIPHLMITANVFARGRPALEDWITPEVAASWVTYTNKTRGQYVAYWELGNEVNLNRPYNLLPLDAYVSKIHTWSTAMKAVDPTIKIGAVVDAPFRRELGEDWNGPLLQQAAGALDFLIIHPYANVTSYLNSERPWRLWVDRAQGARASMRREASAAEGQAALRVDVQAATPANYHVALYQADLPVAASAQYQLSFWGRAAGPRLLSNIVVQQDGGGWMAYSPYFSAMLSDQWQYFEFTFDALGSDPAAALLFALGDAAGEVWLDGVSLVRMSDGMQLMKDGGFEEELGAFGDEAALKTAAFLWNSHTIADLRAQADFYAPGRPLEIQASEWNLWYDTTNLVEDLRISETLFEAVLGADMLWDMIAEGVDGAHIWTLCGSPWPSLDPSPAALLYAQYYMLQMSSQQAGHWLLKSAVAAPTYGAGPLDGWYFYTEYVEEAPVLAVYATSNPAGDQVSLIVTNKSSQPEPATISLLGFLPDGAAAIWQLTSLDWSDMGLAPSASMIGGITAPAFEYTFPPRSLTRIQLSGVLAYPLFLPLVVKE
ncbi:MAG: carbohydrate binding domain-containing protein [Chloroflexota bacterium]